MGAKDIQIAPISASAANRLIKKLHYSGKVVTNSKLHLGVFLDGRCLGALSFGPSLDKRKLIGLVTGTKWNEFIELNRMALSDELPRNGESRALAVSMRLIRKNYPGLKWVISFADGCLCGDGTIYRAAGFSLTGVKSNKQIFVFPEPEEMDSAPLIEAGLSAREIATLREWLTYIKRGGGPISLHLHSGKFLPFPSERNKPIEHKMTVEDRPAVVHKMTLEGAPSAHRLSGEGRNRPCTPLSSVKEIMRKVTHGKTSASTLFKLMGGRPAPGFQLRYIYFLDKSARERLTVPEIPYSSISDAGARMYRGERIQRAESIGSDATVSQAV